MKKQVLLMVVMLLMAVIDVMAQAPNWQWVNGIGGPGNESKGGKSVTDAAGNVYVTGTFTSQTIILGNDTLHCNNTNNLFIAKYNPNGNVIWAKCGSPNKRMASNDIKVDGNGNIYITGWESSFSFDTVGLPGSSNGNSRFFVLKLNSSGYALWARCNSDIIGIIEGRSLDVDTSGNVYVTGQYGIGTNWPSNSLDIFTFGTDTLRQEGAFVIKYDSAGNKQWVHGLIGRTAIGNSIATDNLGNVFVTGSYECPYMIVGADTMMAIDSVFSGNCSRVIFIIKYDAAGNVIWKRKGEVNNFQGSNEGNGVDVDAFGNVYVTGVQVDDTLHFDSLQLVRTGNYPNAYIVKYSNSGVVQWIKGISDNVFGYNIVTDALGNAYIVGAAMGNIIINGLDTIYNYNSYNAVVFKLSPSGNFLWGKGTNYVGDCSGTGIAINGTGDIFVSGIINHDELFGALFVNHAGNGDYFLAKLVPCSITKTPNSPTQICQGSSITIQSTTAGSNYQWYWSGWPIIGATNNSYTATTPGFYAFTMTTANNCTAASDNVQVNVKPLPIVDAGANKTICAGQYVTLTGSGNAAYYLWNNGVVNGGPFYPTTTTTYTVTGITTNNCSSTDSVTVTVNPSPIVSITQNVNTLSSNGTFNSYQWYFNGVAIAGATNASYTATQDGGYYVKVTNTYNCSGLSNAILLTVGINDVNNNSISISPNPTDNIITIKGITQPSVAVYNLMGQKVIVAQGSNEVSLAQLPSGLYMVQVFNKDMELVKSEKVILNR